MKHEIIKQVSLTAYTVDGRPTCGVDFKAGKFCKFSTTRKLGQIPVCGATGLDLDYSEDPTGYSKPGVDCPIWKGYEMSNEKDTVKTCADLLDAVASDLETGAQVWMTVKLAHTDASELLRLQVENEVLKAQHQNLVGSIDRIYRMLLVQSHSTIAANCAEDALEELNQCDGLPRTAAQLGQAASQAHAAITVIREALAEQESEPVAIVRRNPSGQLRLEDSGGDAFDISAHIEGTRFYTHPAPANQQASVPDVWKPVLEAVLREMPRRTTRKGNAPGHAHSTSGIWDDDNGDLAGTECAWCKAWNTAVAMLATAPETPPQQWQELSEDEVERLIPKSEDGSLWFDIVDMKNMAEDVDAALRTKNGGGV